MKQAWESKDFTLLATMFPEKPTYYESPFLPPLTEKQQIINQWKIDLAGQEDIHFDYTILREEESECFANWSATFVRENKTVSLDGIFYFKLVNNQCTYFKQWWVMK